MVFYATIITQMRKSDTKSSLTNAFVYGNNYLGETLPYHLHFLTKSDTKDKHILFWETFGYIKLFKETLALIKSEYLQPFLY